MPSSKRSKRHSELRKSKAYPVAPAVKRTLSTYSMATAPLSMFKIWGACLLSLLSLAVADSGNYAQGGTIELSDKNLYGLARTQARLQTRVAAEFPTTIPLYYVEGGYVSTYAAGRTEAIPLTVILKLTDEQCSKAGETFPVYQDTRYEDPVIAVLYPGSYQATADTLNGNGFRLRNLAMRKARIIVKYLDLNRAIEESGESCSDTRLSSSVRGLPRCIAPDDGSRPFDNDKYLKIFGSQAYTRCIIDNGNPCSTEQQGYGNTPYHHPYGCYECTLGEQGYCSYDHFAIRPKAFDVNLSGNPTFRAGKAVLLNFLALDAEGTIGSNDITHTAQEYNETQNHSFSVDLNVTHNRYCQIKNLTMTPEVHFRHGIHSGLFAFDDIGDIHLTLHEVNGSEFAHIDAEDTPDEKRLIEAYHADLSIIPDHFDLHTALHDHHDEATAHFTYLSDDIHMSSVMELNITAVGEENATTFNFTDRCYGSPADLNLTIAYPDDSTSPPPLHHLLYSIEGEDSPYSTEGNSTELSKIGLTLPTELFPASEHNGTALITVKLNFDREYQRPIEPFTMRMTALDITAGDPPDHLIKGTEVPDGNATYYFARVKASLMLYDDEVSPAVTPISVVIYHNPAASPFDLNLTLFLPTDTYDWYLSTEHNASDGRITLATKNPSLANVTEHPTISDGLDRHVKVSTVTDTRPLTVEINLTGTDRWLVYNPDRNSEPDPFYRVRFTGTPYWFGYGSTGNVVEGNLSSTRNRRLEW